MFLHQAQLVFDPILIILSCYVQKKVLKTSREIHRGKPIQILLSPSLHLFILRSNLKYNILQVAFFDYVLLRGLPVCFHTALGSP